MKKLELLLVVFVVISVCLNLLLIPGASFLTILSFSLLSLLYQFFSFALFNNVGFRNLFKKESYKGLKALRIIASIGIGWILSLSLMGILFKIQSYPGAQVLLIVASALLLILFMISLFKYISTKSDFYLGICKRLIPTTIMVLIFVNISSLNWVKFKFRNYPDYIELYEKFLQDPNNQELEEELYKKKINLGNN